jgi:metallo-beta-lactamase family protein
MTATPQRPASGPARPTPGPGVARTALTFLGGAGTATGTTTMLEHCGRRVLVDCGLVRGAGELRGQERDALPVPAGRIEAVVLSHADLDHCGYLPALARQGFSGRVLCTPGTAELAAVVLRDGARLADGQASHARRAGWSGRADAPLYGPSDAEQAIRLLEVVPEDHPVEAMPGVVVELPAAGHILGSASPVVRVECGPAERLPGRAAVAFSGDRGMPSHPLLLPPGPPPSADALVVESTSGDRLDPDASTAGLAAAVRRTVARGGVVVVPASVVDRTEVVLLALARLMRAGAVPTVPVHLDSATVDTGDLRASRTAEESLQLDASVGPCIIVSGSGPGSAAEGRVLHHLAHVLPDRRSTVLLIGYQAVGTRGRELADGVRAVRIHGLAVPVRAEVVQLEDLSVHADADDLLAWLRSAPAAPQACYVTHGGPAATALLAGRIRDELGWCAVAARPGERILVGADARGAG